MALLHFRNAILELLESVSIRHGYWRRMESMEGVLRLRPNRVLTMGEREAMG